MDAGWGVVVIFIDLYPAFLPFQIVIFIPYGNSILAKFGSTFYTMSLHSRNIQLPVVFICDRFLEGQLNAALGELAKTREEEEEKYKLLEGFVIITVTIKLIASVILKYQETDFKQRQGKFMSLSKHQFYVHLFCCNSLNYSPGQISY